MTTDEDAECSTVVAGTFQAPSIFRARGNALVLAVGREENRVRHGVVLSIDSAGVLFDEGREFSPSDPEPKRYAYDEVTCLVDSARRVVYGSAPKGMSAEWDAELWFTNLDSVATAERHDVFDLGHPRTSTAEIQLSLEPGRPFSFCVEPGRYVLSGIRLTRFDQIAWADPIPMLGFHAEKGYVNNLGALRLDMDSSGAPGVCAFRCKTIERDTPSRWSWFGGRSESGTSRHVLRVVADTTHRSTLRLPIRPAMLRLESNPQAPSASPER